MMERFNKSLEKAMENVSETQKTKEFFQSIKKVKKGYAQYAEKTEEEKEKKKEKKLAKEKDNEERAVTGRSVTQSLFKGCEKMLKVLNHCKDAQDKNLSMKVIALFNENKGMQTIAGILNTFKALQRDVDSFPDKKVVKRKRVAKAQEDDDEDQDAQDDEPVEDDDDAKEDIKEDDASADTPAAGDGDSKEPPEKKQKTSANATSANATSASSALPEVAQTPTASTPLEQAIPNTPKMVTLPVSLLGDVPPPLEAVPTATNLPLPPSML